MPPGILRGTSRPQPWERRSTTCFRTLCDSRCELLAREGDAGTVPATYEFPREFRKVRGITDALQFLVDLCRPQPAHYRSPSCAASIFPAFARSPLTNLYPPLRVEQAAASSAGRHQHFPPRRTRARAGAGARHGNAAGGPVALPQPSVSRRHSAGSRGSGRQLFEHEDEFCATRDARLRHRPLPDSHRVLPHVVGAKTRTTWRSPDYRSATPGYFFQRIRGDGPAFVGRAAEARRPAAGGRRVGNL